MALCETCNGCGKQEECDTCENNDWVPEDDQQMER